MQTYRQTARQSKVGGAREGEEEEEDEEGWGRRRSEGSIDCDTATVIYAERQDESEER